MGSPGAVNCRKQAEEMRKSLWRSHNDACDQGRKYIDAHVGKHVPCTHGPVIPMSCLVCRGTASVLDAVFSREPNKSMALHGMRHDA